MDLVILGAGPAGLAAAYAHAKGGGRPVVLEKADQVGGICRTLCHRGYYFDLGGHRFFTRYDEVQALWEEILGDALLLRPRQSRILFDGKLYDYPLRARNALANLGLRESARCMASYARARLRPRGAETTFEEWVSHRFGRRLFDLFFRTYTEKVWGIPTDRIGAEWASQRIKNLDLGTAVKKALGLGRGAQVTSLIEEFWYPRTGPGLMYDTMRDKAAALGAQVLVEHAVVGLDHADGRVHRVHTRGPDGQAASFPADHVLSSIPLTHLVRAMAPTAPAPVVAAARRLRFRHLVAVNLVVDRADLFPDNWIYVHDRRLQVCRIQNYGNWSPHMVPDPTTSALGLEYFCSDGEDLWAMGDDQLIALASHELAATGLAPGARVTSGMVARVPRAYPVYELGYERDLAVITDWIGDFANLQPIGRAGMFKYNNSDHSILTALLAVENLDQGAHHDVWAVNADTDYHEVRRG